MKAVSLLLIFILIHLGEMKAQTDKPRFLKKATVLSPIDMTKSYTKDGLIKGNKRVVMILTDSSIVEVLGEKKELKVKTKKYVYDTVLTRNILIDKGYAFDIVQQIGRFSIVKFWDLRHSKALSLINRIKYNINPIDEKNLKELRLDDELSNLKVEGLIATNGNETFNLSKSFFIIPTAVLLANSAEFENKTNTWDIGILALPVKIRPFATEEGQFDFTSGYSVGTTLAWNIYHNWQSSFRHNILLYAGVGSYTADEGKIKEKRADYKIPIFSPGIGYMWERKNVQLSLLMGIDFPSGNLQQKWVYRNKPWFGIGLGIGLFKIDNQTSTETGKN